MTKRMPTDRPVLRGAVDEDTLDRWRTFADVHGLDISSLLEAIGRALPRPGERLPGWLQAAVSEARRVRAERKDRRPAD